MSGWARRRLRSRRWMEATIRGQYDLICDLEAELEELRGFADYIETSEYAAAVMHLHRSHMTNTWLWLCAHHHRNVAVPA